MAFKRVGTILGVLMAVFVAGALAHGCWHAISHGVVYVSVRDSSGTEVRHPDADLVFLDGMARVLAEYATHDASGLFYASRPAMFSCYEVERRAPFQIGGQEAYRQCWERQSRWLVSWVRDVRYANARFGACRWEKIPVVVSTKMDGPVTWWLWWVDPWRGSMPLTTTDLRLTIDTNKCAAQPLISGPLSQRG